MFRCKVGDMVSGAVYRKSAPLAVVPLMGVGVDGGMWRNTKPDTPSSGGLVALSKATADSPAPGPPRTTGVGGARHVRRAGVGDIMGGVIMVITATTSCGPPWSSRTPRPTRPGIHSTPNPQHLANTLHCDMNATIW